MNQEKISVVMVGLSKELVSGLDFYLFSKYRNKVSIYATRSAVRANAELGEILTQTKSVIGLIGNNWDQDNITLNDNPITVAALLLNSGAEIFEIRASAADGDLGVGSRINLDEVDPYLFLSVLDTIIERGRI